MVTAMRVIRTGMGQTAMAMRTPTMTYTVRLHRTTLATMFHYWRKSPRHHRSSSTS
ncbi:MAG: hypothetical protein R3C99_17805 [Pirellulaceae bacterium]